MIIVESVCKKKKKKEWSINAGAQTKQNKTKIMRYNLVLFKTLLSV